MPDDPRPYLTSTRKQWGKLKASALQMRREPTVAESVLWPRIRNRQIENAKFRRQHSIEGFIVDFVCIEQMLIIEVNGAIHDHADQRAYDTERQAILEARGFQILRFTNAEVLQSLETVAQAIVGQLKSPE